MDPSPRLLDAHALIVSADKTHYPFDPKAAAAAPAEIAAAIDAEGLLDRIGAGAIGGAVLVQRNRFYGLDNTYVCDAAAAHPDRFKAVCAVDGRDPACAEQARHWLRERGAAGVRFMEAVRADDLDWLASAAARDAWRIAADVGAIVQVHFFSWNRVAGMPAFLALARVQPQTRVIIDAVSNIDPSASDHGIDDLLRAAADLPSICIKVTSSMLARLPARGIDAAVLVRRVVDLFGAERVLWGSDLFSPGIAYEDAIALAKDSVRLLASVEQGQVLGGNAARLFDWGGQP